MFPSNMISPLIPNAQLNHVYQYVQPPMAQAPPTAQPDMIVTSAPRQQSVIQGRAGPQTVDGGFNYVNGDLHNTQYNTYILTPAGGPSPHQQNAPSHAPPTGPGSSVPAAGNSITGGTAQQYVDYSMSMAASGYLPAAVPQGPAANMQPSTTSGQLLTAGQYAHYPLPGQLENAGQAVNNAISTHSAIDPSSTLWKDLQRQLEYYFSPQNLGNDKFLREHMDAEGFVPISLVAGFNKVISLTTDLQLVTEVLRDSKTVQVDENGEKVRSLVNSGMLILREIPENTPVEEVRQLFNSDRCPPLISCHFMHNDNWLARFESHDDATRAYTYLRESRLLFRGQPIHARLKNPHGSHGLKSPDGMTSPTTPPARQVQPQYPTAPVAPPQQSTGIVQPVQPPQYQPPASQPVAQQQAVYQQAPNTSTRVYTPQPAPQQVPPQMVSQSVAGNMVGPGPQTIQSVPPQPPAGMPTHQLPPGAAVQLLQPQPNFTVVPSNTAWPEQYAFYNPLTGQIMQLTARQPTPVVYDFAPTRMVTAYPDVRYRPPARVMLPVVTHPGFSNAAGANPNSGPFAVSGPSRPMRRESNSRNNALRPSSGSSRYDYSVSRLSHPHNSSSTEMTSPATIDVASSTDITTVADSSVLAMSEPAGMSITHADASTSALHQPEMSTMMEPLPRRAQAQNWRHERDSASSRPGARPGRRGGRHQEDSRSWNTRETPVEQKFNFEATSFPPLTSTNQHTSAEELVRQATQASSGAETDHENQQLPVSCPVGSDHSHLRDVGQLADSISAACSLSDRNAVHSSGALGNDVSPVDTSRQSISTAAVSPARLSYAEITSKGGNKDQLSSGQTLTSPQSIGTTDMEQFPAELHITGEGVGGMSVPPQSRHIYQHSDVPPHHHAAHSVPPHSQNDLTDRHVPPRRGGRGGGGANRPYRMFFPSDYSLTRGGPRWRGGHSHDGSNRVERTLQTDEPAQLQTS